MFRAGGANNILRHHREVPGKWLGFATDWYVFFNIEIISSNLPTKYVSLLSGQGSLFCTKLAQLNRRQSVYFAAIYNPYFSDGTKQI